MLKIKDLYHLIFGRFFTLVDKVINPAKKIEVLAHAQTSIEGKFLCHIANMSSGRTWGYLEIDAIDKSFAFGWTQQPAEHFESCRLAGAIGAQQAKDLPSFNRKRNLMSCDKCAKFFRQPFRDDCIFGVPFHFGPGISQLRHSSRSSS